MTAAQSLSHWPATSSERARAVSAMRQRATELRAASGATEESLARSRREPGGSAEREAGMWAHARALAYAADEIEALADSL